MNHVLKNHVLKNHVLKHTAIQPAAKKYRFAGLGISELNFLAPRSGAL
jgi:hypothetical protein